MEPIMTDEEIKELISKAVNPDPSGELLKKVRKTKKYKLDYVKILQEVSEKVHGMCNVNIQMPVCVVDVPAVCDPNGLMEENAPVLKVGSPVKMDISV